MMTEQQRWYARLGSDPLSLDLLPKNSVDALSGLDWGFSSREVTVKAAPVSNALLSVRTNCPPLYAATRRFQFSAIFYDFDGWNFGPSWFRLTRMPLLMTTPDLIVSVGDQSTTVRVNGNWNENIIKTSLEQLGKKKIATTNETILYRKKLKKNVKFVAASSKKKLRKRKPQ